MRILLVGTSYPSSHDDWKGRFIKDLVHALATRDGLDLRLWAPPGEIPENVVPILRPDESEWLHRMLASGGIAHILREKGWKASGTVLNLLNLLRRGYRRAADADLFHVNWLQNAIPLWGINKPAVISVLGTDFAMLNRAGMVLLLRSVLGKRKTIIAPNAGWMVEHLNRLFGDLAEIRAIPFGVDHPWFEVKRSTAAGPRKWLVVLRLTSKKMGQLFPWGEGLFGKQDELHILGPMQETVVIPPWAHFHGATHPRELLERWFPEAAGLITLSEHDEGRPQVILEAMAAGLPVIASDQPAHRDVILNGKTGWLVSSRHEFQEGLSWLKEKDNNIRMGEQAKMWIRDHVGTWDDCAERYLKAYQSVMR
jgi:glycosyltransferase involved in cell wall biosynthesis